MSLRNYNVLGYLPPIGEDLQHVKCANGVSYHSDIYLLTHVSELVKTQSMLDAIQARFTSIKDTMPAELQDATSKLDDFQRMELTDSRFLQSLSDRTSQLKDYMSKVDDFVQKNKDADFSKKLSDARKNMEQYMIKLFGND